MKARLAYLSHIRSIYEPMQVSPQHVPTTILQFVTLFRCYFDNVFFASLTKEWLGDSNQNCSAQTLKMKNWKTQNKHHQVLDVK